MIDHTFHDLFPARGMAERPEQVSLSHLMLDAMLDGSIALCDAGTGIGKTYSYLVAGAAFLRLRSANGAAFRPILVSTSSIALQNAVQSEYLPFLSDALLEDGLTDQSLNAVIRKGKSHYVCDIRLEQRLGQLDLSKKNWKAGKALLSLREQLDMDAADHLSNYDRQRVCVPQICDCGRESCRYLSFLEECAAGNYPFQICNHNLLLADAIHRGTGRSPILPDACAVVIDEAHKLPEAARLVAASSISLASAFRRKLAHSAAAPLPTKAERRFRGDPLSAQNFQVRRKRERTERYWSGSLLFMLIFPCSASNSVIRRLISCSISLFFVRTSYSAITASFSSKI